MPITRFARPDIDPITLINYLHSLESALSGTMIGGTAQFLPGEDTLSVRIPQADQFPLVIINSVTAAAIEILRLAEFEYDDRGIIAPRHTLDHVMRSIAFHVYGIFGYSGIFRAANIPGEYADETGSDFNSLPRIMNDLNGHVMHAIMIPKVDNASIIARILHTIVLTKPFPYGNERMARLLATWALLVTDHGSLPRVTNKAAFNAAFNSATAGLLRNIIRGDAVEWQSAWTPRFMGTLSPHN